MSLSVDIWKWDDMQRLFGGLDEHGVFRPQPSVFNARYLVSTTLVAVGIYTCE